MARKKTAFNRCMSKELKGKLRGKSKSTRQRMFKSAAKKCAKR